jgi:phosphopantothenoylcysteine decarboxylase/phosphopantothenate--cysteine ligase
VAQLISAPTADEMRTAVLAALPSVDALVMAAAVADFRPAKAAPTKLVRGERLSLELEPTPDILAEASHANARATGGRRALLIGFAAETGSLERVADKMKRKGVDLLVANDVAEAGSGFGSQTNRVTLYAPGVDPEPWPLLAKEQVADRLLDRITALLMLRDAGLDAGADDPGSESGTARSTAPLRPIRAGGGGPVEPASGQSTQAAAGKPVSEVAP